MGIRDGVDRLFFELASESRLGILQELQTKELRMQETARKLELTDTETCRQLQRLSEAQLIQKQPNGTYRLTSYAKLQIQLISSVEFVFRNTDYFSDHDIFCLPYEFVNRLGELSVAEFCREAMSGFNRVRKMVCLTQRSSSGALPNRLTQAIFSQQQKRELRESTSSLSCHKNLPKLLRILMKTWGF